MDSTDLKKWALDNNVEERALNGFWKAFNNYTIECSDEITKYYGVLDKTKLNVRLEKVSLVSDWNNCIYDYIIALVPIIYREEKIGRYELKFRLTGETFDDCLVNEILA